MSAEPGRRLVAYPAITARLSAADAVCQAIRQEIITGRYAGGQRLTEEHLAGQFGTSRTSVREVLRVLAAEGFVQIRPYFGVFVATMTADEATELLELQAELEAMAAGLAAARRSTEDLAELWDIVDTGRAAAARGELTTSATMHGRFHQALSQAAHNRSLTTVMTQLRYKVDWVYATKVRRPPGDSWAEHHAIVEAVARQDVDLATRSARDHVRHGSRAQFD